MRDPWDIKATWGVSSYVLYHFTFHFSHVFHLFPFRKLFPEACRPELTQEMMQKADVDPMLRPPELTIPQIRALADAYAHLCTLEPGLRSYEFREELRLRHLARQRKTPMNTFIGTSSGTQPSSPQHYWKGEEGEQRNWEKPTNSRF